MKNLIIATLSTLVSISAFALPHPGMTAQPDAKVAVLLDQFPSQINGTDVCKQKVKLDNGNYSMILCGHKVGDTLHALTDRSGLIIKGYVTSEEYKTHFINKSVINKKS